MGISVALWLILIGVGCSQAVVQVVDMTHGLDDRTIFWPGNPSYQFNILTRGNTSAGFWYESNSFFTPEHGGTHVDAPSHFAQGAWRAEHIPVSHLAGSAVVIDVKVKAAANADYRLSVKDVEDWENAHGRVPAKGIVLMNSGWASRYPNKTLVFNTDTPTNASTFHFPGLHPDTATFLATQRSVIAVGVDTPSTDYGQSTSFRAHVNLAKHNVIGLENLASLDQLPARGSTVIIGMVKLVDGSGGPARILALVGEGADVFGSGTAGGHRLAAAEVLVCWVVVVTLWVGVRW